MSYTFAIDTNLLVLLIVGLTKREYISAHKRLKAFVADDFDLLVQTIASGNGLVVTPNTLSETSNLLRQIAEPARTEIDAVFHTFIQGTEERYVKSLDASARREFVRFGLSDNALLEVAKSEVTILSVDLNLCIAAEIAEYKFLNFNHLRDGVTV